MKRRFLVEMIWREPGEYILNSYIGVIADGYSWGMYGLVFEGPYDKTLHGRRVIIAFPPNSFRMFLEVPVGTDWPVEPYKSIGEDWNRSEG